jgi:hypothetical protein
MTTTTKRYRGDRRTYIVTTSGTLILRDGRHILCYIGAGERLDEWAARMAEVHGAQLARVAYCSSEVCVSTGAIVGLTTTWYTAGELADLVEREAHVAKLRQAVGVTP